MASSNLLWPWRQQHTRKNGNSILDHQVFMKWYTLKFFICFHSQWTTVFLDVCHAYTIVTFEEFVNMKQSQIKQTRDLCVVFVWFDKSMFVRWSVFAAASFILWMICCNDVCLILSAVWTKVELLSQVTWLLHFLCLASLHWLPCLIHLFLSVCLAWATLWGDIFILFALKASLFCCLHSLGLKKCPVWLGDSSVTKMRIHPEKAFRHNIHCRSQGSRNGNKLKCHVLR